MRRVFFLMLAGHLCVVQGEAGAGGIGQGVVGEVSDVEARGSGVGAWKE